MGACTPAGTSLGSGFLTWMVYYWPNHQKGALENFKEETLEHEDPETIF